MVVWSVLHIAEPWNGRCTKKQERSMFEAFQLASLMSQLVTPYSHHNVGRWYSHILILLLADSNYLCLGLLLNLYSYTSWRYSLQLWLGSSVPGTIPCLLYLVTPWFVCSQGEERILNKAEQSHYILSRSSIHQPTHAHTHHSSNSYYCPFSGITISPPSSSAATIALGFSRNIGCSARGT